MKALTVRQPWASLIVHGPKWIETRTRPAPAALIGQRIGVIAGTHRPKAGEAIGNWTVGRGVDGDHGLHTYETPGCDDVWMTLLLGALIGSVELYDCVPIVDPVGDVGDRCICTDSRSRLWFYPASGVRVDDLADQLPYGDYTAGRWAWLLRDPRACTAMPMRGAAGLVEIPAEALKVWS